MSEVKNPKVKVGDLVLLTKYVTEDTDAVMEGLSEVVRVKHVGYGGWRGKPERDPFPYEPYAFEGIIYVSEEQDEWELLPAFPTLDHKDPRSVYAAVAAERDRQDDKWGPRHDDLNSKDDWSEIIGEYSRRLRYGGDVSFRQNLTVVAAVAIAALESDRRKTAAASREEATRDDG